MSDRLLTAEDVGQMLGVTPEWVYAQSRAGRIPTITLGRYRRYRVESIEEWLREIEAVGRTAPGHRATASLRPGAG